MKVRHQQQGAILLPDFLIVGAAKSATSSLYFYLDQHPQIHMSAIKESWFFSFVNTPPNYTSPVVLDNVVSCLEDYVKLFDGAHPDQCLGEASPSYLYTYRDTIRHIRSVYPSQDLEKLKIIISLRDPVSRAYSQYMTFKRRACEPLSFDDAIEQSTIEARLRDNWNIFYDYIGFGRYCDQVGAYLDAFGRDKVLILWYDDIERDPQETCRTIYKFLGVDQSFVADVSTRYNSLTGEPAVNWIMAALLSRNRIKRAVAARVPRKLRLIIIYLFAKLLLRRKEMAGPTRTKLMRIFAEDLDRLEELTQRDLSAWKTGA